MENVKQKLIDSIEEQRAIINKAGVTIDEALKIQAQAPSIDDPKKYLAFWSTNEAALVVVNAHRTLTRLEESLELDLAKPTTRYVLTDEALCNPAGFVLEDGVFIKNQVWIETDRLPRSTNLKVFDLQKLRSKDAVYHNGKAA